MAKRVEDMELDPVVVPIDHDADVSPTRVKEWLERLAHGDRVELSTRPAELLREIREHGER
jgi:hypothetical protein